MKGAFVLVAFLAIDFCFAEEDYEGYKVLRVIPKNERQLKFMQKIADSDAKIDFWRGPMAVGQPIDLMTNEKTATMLEGLLNISGVKAQIMNDNVGDLIRNEKGKVTPGTPFAHDEYLQLDNLLQYVQTLVDQHSDKAEVIEVGTSYEGRTITAVKISTGGSGKKAIWIDGGIHAREWVSPATMLYNLDTLLNGYDSDAAIKRVLDTVDVFILPVFNVDGYVYTWTTDRMWRKTRSPNAGSSCAGCDPNRNWDFHWGEVGVSSNPCTETFPGPNAFSEVEVRTVVDFISNIPNLSTYMAVHSYGQMYMLPYGFTSQRVPDFDELMSVCTAAVGALKDVHGETYRCESLINLVGPNSGGSVDYTYGALNIKFSFGVELRDTGLYGFILPPAQILPTAEENFAALMSIINYVIDNE